LLFNSIGVIANIAANCITIKIPNATIDVVTGNIATFTILNTTWKTIGRSRLPLVLLKNHVIKKVVGTINRKFIMK